MKQVKDLPAVLPVGHVTWSGFDNWIATQEYELTINPRTLEHLTRVPRLKPGQKKTKWSEGNNHHFKDRKHMMTGRGYFYHNYVHVVRSRHVPAEIQTIPGFFDIEHGYFNLNRQEPGGCSPMHVDSMSDYYVKLFKHLTEADTNRLGRILMALDDWEPGHFWAVGDGMWMNYKRGDLVYVDVWNLPHGTGNCSFTPRHTLLIDGLYTAETVKHLLDFTTEINLDTGTAKVSSRE